MCKEKTCCVFGHRKILYSEKLILQIKEVVYNLITNKNVDTFLFGSRSDFDSLCLKIVSDFQVAFPHIKRVYVRAEFPEINDKFTKYLLESYDETYFREKIKDAGKSVYVQRNKIMIDSSKFCLVYYNKEFCQYNKNSGTLTALNYANKNGLEVFNVLQ